MDNPGTHPFVSLAQPLFERFGPALTIERGDACVRWLLDGQTVTVAPGTDATLVATFATAPMRDAVSEMPLVATYRGAAGYALDVRGVARIVDDLAAFFSGIREPRFAFVDLVPSESYPA